jgi:hypothetical protein
LTDRIGAIAFGLGTLIYTGLEFLTFFETPQGCDEWDIILGINPTLYMIFVFMQVIGRCGTIQYEIINL